MNNRSRDGHVWVMRVPSLALLSLLVAGCTSTAGPFVTSIRYGGPGLLVLEKCMVEHTKVGNHIATTDCFDETVAIGPGAAYVQPAPVRPRPAYPYPYE